MTLSRDQKIGIVIIICCAIILFVLVPFQVTGKKASIFPRFSLVWIITWSLALVMVSKGEVEHTVTVPKTDRKTRLRTISFAACTVVYAALINIIGFYSSSLIFLLVSMFVLGVKNIKLIIIIPIAIPIAIYFLTTKLLYFRFPRGFLF